MLTDPFSIEMLQKDFDISVCISMVGAVNTTVIPVPAAVWLFGSGLMGLIALAQRKR